MPVYSSSSKDMKCSFLLKCTHKHTTCMNLYTIIFTLDPLSQLCFLPFWLSLQPWTWRWHVHKKFWLTFNNLCCVISHRELFITTAVRTSTPTQCILITFFFLGGGGGETFFLIILSCEFSFGLAAKRDYKISVHKNNLYILYIQWHEPSIIPTVVKHNQIKCPLLWFNTLNQWFPNFFGSRRP
jgi:hypothetical protein